MHNIAEMLVGYCVGKFSSATPNQNNTNITTNETHQQLEVQGIYTATAIFTDLSHQCCMEFAHLCHKQLLYG